MGNTGKLTKIITTKEEHDFIVVRADNLFQVAKFIGRNSLYILRVEAWGNTVGICAQPERGDLVNLEIGDIIYLDGEDEIVKYNRDTSDYELSYDDGTDEDKDAVIAEMRGRVGFLEEEWIRQEAELCDAICGFDPKAKAPPNGLPLLFQSKIGVVNRGFHTYGKGWTIFGSDGVVLKDDFVVRWWPSPKWEVKETR